MTNAKRSSNPNKSLKTRRNQIILKEINGMNVPLEQTVKTDGEK